jgi:Trk K+ transport system NAD-binding subunit
MPGSAPSSSRANSATRRSSCTATRSTLETLIEANIASAETIVAVTNDDETNIFSSVLAKRLGCKRAITLVNKTQLRADHAVTLGMDAVVSPNAITISTILRHVRHRSVSALYTLREGFGEVIDAQAQEIPLVSAPLRDDRPARGLAHRRRVRDGDVIIPPRPDLEIKPGDSVIAMVTYKSLPRRKPFSRAIRVTSRLSAGDRFSALRGRRLYLRPIMYLIGGMLTALADRMLAPMLVDLHARNDDWRAFAASSVLTLVAGLGMMRASHCTLTGGLTLRQAFLLTPVAWGTIALFAAIPLYFSGYAQLNGSFTNAFFESMSGLTTTGATVLTRLRRGAARGSAVARPAAMARRHRHHRHRDRHSAGAGRRRHAALSHGILRSFGEGAPARARGRTDDSRRLSLLHRRVRTDLLGHRDDSLRRVAHALSTVSTAGFSTKDASFAYWNNPALDWAAVFFMITGAAPFVLYVQLLQGRRDPLRDTQVRTLLGFLAVVVSRLSPLGFTSAEPTACRMRCATRPSTSSRSSRQAAL